MSAWIVYNIVLSAARFLKDEASIHSMGAPIEDLKPVVTEYFSFAAGSVTSDPLGFGLTAWKLQWLAGAPAARQRQALRQQAASAMNVRRHLSLPFRYS